MVLAEPVLNNFGQALLNPGITINSHHIRILKTWNIHSLHIKTSENETENEISSDIIKIAEESLKSRMTWLPEKNIETDLFNAAVIVCATHIRDGHV